MSFNYSVALSDPGNAGGSADPVLVYDLQQALGVWSQYITGAGTLVVQLNIDNTPQQRADGGPTSSQFVGTSPQGFNIFEPSSLYELTTGQHVSGTSSDITITVSPAYFVNLDLDPGLTYDSEVPNNKYNPIIVFLHELEHGFGMSGFYSQSGTLSGNAESTFDTLIQKNGSSAFFTGANAEAAYGGPVPLTTNSTAGENYYHFGNQQDDIQRTPGTVHDPLTLDLMNGIVLFFNYQYPISGLDLGVLKDLGYAVGSAGGATVRDFNGDGKSDVLFQNAGNGDTGYWTTNSSGAVTGFHDFAHAAAAYTLVGTGDFDGDGRADVLFENKSSGDTGYWLTDGSGAVTGFHDFGAANTAYTIVGVGDFDNDSRSDVLFENKSNGDAGYWTTNSGGAVTGFHDFAHANLAYTIVAVGDFDGDGRADILFQNASNADTGYWTTNTGGAVTGFHDYGSANPTYSIVGSGDFDGGGDAEILFENKGNGDTGYWLTNGSGQVTGFHDFGKANTAYSIVAVGDYDGDGRADVLFQNKATGDTGYWTTNSSGVVTGFHDFGKANTSYALIGS